MGGRPVDTGKGPVVEPPKERIASLTKGKWMSSTVFGDQLDHLSMAGYLPPPEVAFAHSPIVINTDGSVWA